MEQQTDEWHRLRLPCITASRTLDIINQRKGYLNEKRKELKTGTWKTFSSRATDWGNHHEPMARGAYELRNDVDVEVCGFMVNIEFPYFGASCDGSVNQDGLIEVKCPFLPHNFLDFITNNIPEEYYAQIQGQLFITGREWCDFVGFDPRQPIKTQLFVKRVWPDPKYFSLIRDNLPIFWEKVNDDGHQDIGRDTAVPTFF